jgi:hypothetical protein
MVTIEKQLPQDSPTNTQKNLLADCAIGEYTTHITANRIFVK